MITSCWDEFLTHRPTPMESSLRADAALGRVRIVVPTFGVHSENISSGGGQSCKADFHTTS